MIKNLTYHQHSDLEDILELVGKPFGFWYRIKNIGKIRSPRMLIVNSSPRINQHLIKAHNVNQSEIERRPKGILIHFFSVLNHYVWVIPYENLNIERLGTTYRVFTSTDYIRFSNKFISAQHQSFMELIRLECENVKKNMPQPTYSDAPEQKAI